SSLKSRDEVSRGNFFALFTRRNRLLRYLKCVGIGLPTWFVIGILATFSNELGQSPAIKGKMDPGLSIMWCYVGLSAGDLFSGILSHLLKSRKKAVFYLMLLTFLCSVLYLYAGFRTRNTLYFMM